MFYDESAQLYYGAPYDESDHPVNLKVLVEADQEHSDLTTIKCASCSLPVKSLCS
jgi:hypothetical protein